MTKYQTSQGITLMKFRQLISAATLIVFALPVVTQTKTVSDFVGGVNLQDVKTCTQVINQLKCKLKDLFTDYKICVRKVLLSEPGCRQQSLTFFRLTDGGIFKEIRRYDHLDVILADYVYIADWITGYLLMRHPAIKQLKEIILI